MMYTRKIVKKIPGELTALPKTEHQGYIDDLSKKTKFELEELLERQNKILANKKFVSKLPDKGEKIIQFRDKIMKELDHRKEVERAAVMLSRLNIVTEGKAAMSALEWTGTCPDNIHKENVDKTVELDSDDEKDPLRILAQPTGTGVHKKKIIYVQPEESLIKPEDLEDIKDDINSTVDTEHVKYVVQKTEKSKENSHMKRESFKPYKTTKSNVHDPEKEKERKYNKFWEVTAATPPHIIHGAVISLDFNESLRLQKEHAKKLQEIQAKHAAERLAEQLGLHSIGPLPEHTSSYREFQNNEESSVSSSDNEEEHEVHDDEDHDKGGTVVYTVDSIET